MDNLDTSDTAKFEYKPCGSKLSANDVDMRDYEQPQAPGGGPKCNAEDHLPQLALGPYEDPKPLDGVLRWPRPPKS